MLTRVKLLMGFTLNPCEKDAAVVLDIDTEDCLNIIAAPKKPPVALEKFRHIRAYRVADNHIIKISAN